MTDAAPAGWYPNGDQWETYWDGTAWTGEHRPRVGSSPVPVPVESRTLFPLEADGMTFELRPDGLHCSPTSWTGRATIGKEARTIPWDRISTLEPTSIGFVLREGRDKFAFTLRRQQRALAPTVVEELAGAAHRATGRVIPVTKLSRAERAEVIGAVSSASSDGRLAEIRDAYAAHDRAREAHLSQQYLMWARGEKLRDADERLTALRTSLGEHVPVRLGRFTGGGRVADVYDDRIVVNGVPHLIDAQTQAQVYLDGQVQVTTRASLGAAAFGSILPGSALIPALAFAKKEKTDLRTVELQVGSRAWSERIPLAVTSLSLARSVAQRVNAIADGMVSEPDPAPTAGPQPATDQRVDVVSQIERIVELERSGAINAAQAEAMKNSALGL